MHKILFLLDRAHGENVKGKRSPDGSHIEWKWSDKFVDDLAKDLTALGIPWAETVPEDREPGITKRVRRANKLAENSETSILLSFHNNAGGGHGLELFTSPGEDESDPIAELIAKQLIVDFPECRWRRATKRDLDKEASFTVIAGNKYVKPNYWAVLIEFLFMDTLSDLEKLKDPKYTERFRESILYSIYLLAQKYGFRNFKDQIIVT
ncbi:N-acetylmuramoyl-L-alanine amidase [Flavobacteriaceae bacterium]|nr:N-acetylmuramoyl-L-alanine amidase [Flavobacteriaceae bacterium]